MFIRLIECMKVTDTQTVGQIDRQTLHDGTYA